MDEYQSRLMLLTIAHEYADDVSDMLTIAEQLDAWCRVDEAPGRAGLSWTVKRDNDRAA